MTSLDLYRFTVVYGATSDGSKGQQQEKAIFLVVYRDQKMNTFIFKIYVFAFYFVNEIKDASIKDN
jgi:hypothetical protein